MFTNNRDAYRQLFFRVWDKYKKNEPLEPLEVQLIDVILMHPEYQTQVIENMAYQQQEFELEENPFLHMSLHLAVDDQIRLDKPAGVTAIYERLLSQDRRSAHEVKHLMMQCLARVLWNAQQTDGVPDETAYLQALIEMN